MRIIFIGTSDFGIPTLEKLSTLNYQLLTILTQPDKPVGRKKISTPSPIKLWAETNRIPVLQPPSIRDSRFQIRDSNPDLILVAAYGQILTNDVLDIPKFGAINIHASLLPKYRGATPIQAAILNGDQQTGITLIKMDEKMDHGPVIAQETITLDPNDNYLSLYDKLSKLSAQLASKTLPDWFAGKIKSQPQDHGQATYTKLLTLTDGRLDWTRAASEIMRKIKAFNPEPGTWTTLNKKSVKIMSAETADEAVIELPGKIYIHQGNLAVKCGQGALIIHTIQPASKKTQTGQDFLNGLQDIKTKIFV